MPVLICHESLSPDSFFCVRSRTCSCWPFSCYGSPDHTDCGQEVRSWLFTLSSETLGLWHSLSTPGHDVKVLDQLFMAVLAIKKALQWPMLAQMSTSLFVFLIVLQHAQQNDLAVVRLAPQISHWDLISVQGIKGIACIWKVKDSLQKRYGLEADISGSLHERLERAQQRKEQAKRPSRLEVLICQQSSLS